MPFYSDPERLKDYRKADMLHGKKMESPGLQWNCEKNELNADASGYGRLLLSVDIRKETSV